jgi:hypothetical protein
MIDGVPLFVGEMEEGKGGDELRHAVADVGVLSLSCFISCGKEFQARHSRLLNRVLDCWCSSIRS